MITEIQTRHSTRRFAPTPLPQTLLDEILYAGTLAPSPKNRKPWAFITVMDTAKTQRIGDFFFAYPEIKEWLKCDGVPVAALALGYAEKV